MVGGGGSSLAGDPSRGVDKVAGEDVDLKKLTVNKKDVPVGEQIIEGVTNDSIDEYVEAVAKRGGSKTGLLARLRAFFGRQ